MYITVEEQSLSISLDKLDSLFTTWSLIPVQYRAVSRATALFKKDLLSQALILFSSLRKSQCCRLYWTPSEMDLGGLA